jgi:peptidoglycan lytic transglycosylase G
VVARALGLLAAAACAAVLVAGCGGDPKPKPTVPVGPKILHIVFPEGFTRREMAERIDAVRKIAQQKRHVTPRITAAGYLAATASSKLPGLYAGDRKRRSLEGFLFPAKYAFFSNETARHFVTRQAGALRLAMRKVNMSYARSKNQTRYDVLIIASMIEREVVIPSERRLVSAVIYNRLHDHVPIGIDAALRYGLNIPPTKSITKADLRSSSPYNVRKFTGLPPTPIGNPGLASIQAAAHPAPVPYLYYARKKDKRHHFFTASYAEFQKFLAENGYG